MAMKRGECLKILAKYRKIDDVVVTCWQSIVAWDQVSPSILNYKSMRTMGDCSTFGLGLALARPDKKVMVLEGDGSLCMSLFSLVTIAGEAPSNLYQFVLHNKIYETTGGQTIPNVDNLDLVKIAQGSGIINVHRYSDTETLDKEIPGVLKEKGPVFILLDLVPDETHTGGKEFGRVRANDRKNNQLFKEALSGTRNAVNH